MGDETKVEDQNRKIALETIIVLTLASLILFLLFKIKIFVFLSLIFLSVSLLSKKLTSKISRLWLGFSHYIGAVNSKIILTLIFYIFLTPIALFFRIFTKNPLLLKMDKSIESYYNIRNYTPNKKDFEKIW